MGPPNQSIRRAVESSGKRVLQGVARLGHHKALLDQLVGFVTKAHGAAAAVIGLVGFAAAGIRWTQRRRHPATLGPVEPVRFSGRDRKAFLERVWSQTMS